MAKVIAVANQKGGVGKTTTALCLGAELQQKGYKVLFIDLDKQCNLTDTLQGDSTQKGAYSIIADKVNAKEVIQVTESGENLIAASEELSVIDTVLNTAKNSTGKEYRLKESLKDVIGLFDYIVIDTAPRLDSCTVNALTVADYLVITSGADSYSIRGIKEVCDIAETVKEYTNSSLVVGGILVTRYNNRSNINKLFMEELQRVAKELHTKVYKTYIRECIAIKESQTVRQPITEYAAKSNANLDYLAFTNIVLRDLKRK